MASAGKQLRNRMHNHTCLQRRAGVRARGGNRLTNQVSNEEILSGSTPLCLAERLAEIYSLLKIFDYVFEIMVPPHGDGSACRHQRLALTLQNEGTVSFWFLQQAYFGL